MALVGSSAACISAAEMTYIVAGGALNSTHSLTAASVVNVQYFSGTTDDVDSIVDMIARLVARRHSTELQTTAAKWFVFMW